MELFVSTIIIIITAICGAIIYFIVQKLTKKCKEEIDIRIMHHQEKIKSIEKRSKRAMEIAGCMHTDFIIELHDDGAEGNKWYLKKCANCGIRLDNNYHGEEEYNQYQIRIYKDKIKSLEKEMKTWEN